MDDASRKLIETYLAEIDKIDHNKKISSFTVSESHPAAVKLAAKLNTHGDEELATKFYSNLLRKGGWFKELKSLSAVNYPLLLAGLQDRLATLGSDKLGFLHEIELRFVLGVPDLNKAARGKLIDLPQSVFSQAVDILLRSVNFANFPGMLKKRDVLVALFTPQLVDHAETALLATQYLGADTKPRYYFTPSEFRFYWLLMMAVQAANKTRFEKLLKSVAQKNLIKNKTEFDETLERIQ